MNKKIINYIWTGVLAFWVPLILVAYSFKLIWPFVTKLSTPIARRIPFHNIAGEFFDFIVGILIILLITLIIGWIVKKTFLRTWTEKIDKLLSTLFPGYSFYKNFLSGTHGGEENRWKSVIVEDEDEFKIGFIIEKQDDLCTIYVPGAPNPYEGEIIFKRNASLRPIDISFAQAVSFIRHYGKGLSEIIKN